MTALAVFRPTCAVCFKLCLLKCVLLLCTYSANMTWLDLTWSVCRRICLLCQQTSLENMNMTPNCDVTNSAHQIQIAIIWHWMNPPHENFMRMPLARLNALQSAKCTTHHHDAVGYKHLRPAQGPNMGKCRPGASRKVPPSPTTTRWWSRPWKSICYSFCSPKVLHEALPPASPLLGPGPALQLLVNFKPFSHLTHMRNIGGLLLLD